MLDACAQIDFDQRGAKVAIPGYGNVRSVARSVCCSGGATVVAISDAHGDSRLLTRKLSFAPLIGGVVRCGRSGVAFRLDIANFRCGLRIDVLSRVSTSLPAARPADRIGDSRRDRP